MEQRRGSCSSEISPWHSVLGTSPSAPSGTVVATMTSDSQIPCKSLFVIMTYPFICLSIKVAPICQSLDGLPISSSAFTDSCICTVCTSSPREELFLHLTSEEARFREGTRLTQGHTAGKQMKKTQVIQAHLSTGPRVCVLYHDPLSP